LSDKVGEIITFTLRECHSTELIVRILEVMTAKYSHHLRHLIEFIIDKLHSTIHENFANDILMIKVSYIYQNIRNYLEPYLSIVIPQILEKFFQKSSEITNAFIDFIMSLARCCPSLLQFMPLISFNFAELLKLCCDKHSLCKPCLRVKICNCIALFITTFKR